MSGSGRGRRSVTKRGRRPEREASQSGTNLAAWIDALTAVPMGEVTEDQILQWVEGPLRRVSCLSSAFSAVTVACPVAVSACAAS